MTQQALTTLDSDGSTVRECIELRPIKGDTEVVLEGYTGQGLVVFRGGSTAAARVKRDLTAILESIVQAALEQAKR